MAELKTKKNTESVDDYLAQIENEKRRADALAVLALLKDVTGEEPTMWGASLIGFGSYHYVYASGREGDWFQVGFAPRKTKVTLYIMSGFAEYDELLERLGKHKKGKSCLHINKLSDVDMDVLRELVEKSVDWIRATYPEPS